MLLVFSALKGTLNQIGRIFIILEEAGLKPNLISYCAALECMGRNPNCSLRVVSRYVPTYSPPLNKDYVKLG